MGKKNGSGPVTSHQRGFFAKMGMISVNNGLIRGPADSFLTAKSVNLAFSGAKFAGLEDFGSLPGLFLQKTVFKSFDITGPIVDHRDLSIDVSLMKGFTPPMHCFDRFIQDDFRDSNNKDITQSQ